MKFKKKKKEEGSHRPLAGAMIFKHGKKIEIKDTGEYVTKMFKRPLVERIRRKLWKKKR
jgi:ribosomal protein L37AE/L43A